MTKQLANNSITTQHNHSTDTISVPHVNRESCEPEMSMELSKLYLCLYNLVCLILWTYCGLRAWSFWLVGPMTDRRSLWEHCGHLVTFGQLSQTIEILHAAFKLVPASPKQTATQSVVRLISVAFLFFVPHSRQSIGVLGMLVAWPLGEISRYPYYIANAFTSKPPYILTWIRYSMFIVLYPTGLFGEGFVIFDAMYVLRKSMETNLTDLSLKLFIASHYLLATIIAYVSLGHFFRLYSSMLRQRKKMLSKYD